MMPRQPLEITCQSIFSLAVLADQCRPFNDGARQAGV